MTEFAVTFKFFESGLVSSDSGLVASVVQAQFVERPLAIVDMFRAKLMSDKKKSGEQAALKALRQVKSKNE